jgi:Zn-dependent protease with chaperone function
MFGESPEEHIRSVVRRFADTLHVRTPELQFVKSVSGPCYEALSNRIDIDERTLNLPEPLLCIVLAHEVGHATQRRKMLLDFVLTVIAVTAWIVVPCVMLAASAEREIWRISAPGLVFVLAYIAYRRRVSYRTMKLELDADAKAAQLCGASHALQALEAMAQRMYIEPARLDAMRILARTSSY